jgi:hypothetical protein
MALQFQLLDGELHQMAMINTPVFGAATVRSFYERQLAEIPNPATGGRDPGKFKAFRTRRERNAPSGLSFCPPASLKKGFHIMDMRPFPRLAGEQNSCAI